MKEKLRFWFGCPCGDDRPWPLRSRKVRYEAWEPFPNRAESIRKLIRKLGPQKSCGACLRRDRRVYVVYWQLAELVG